MEAYTTSLPDARGRALPSLRLVILSGSLPESQNVLAIRPWSNYSS